MNKTELIDKIWEEIPVYRRNQLRKKWVKFVVNEVFDNITECAIPGEPVSIHKFGNFVPKVYKSKLCYNPYYGDYQKTKDKLKLKFKPGKALRRTLEESV